jgi:probable F420-dependent oxidoreductase
MEIVAKPIRFGVIADVASSKQELISLAQRSEATGYSTLLLRDHVVSHPFGHQLGPLVAMASVAMVTNRLRIGTLVISNDFRSPVQLAKEFATLDVISDGRIELGLGAGFLKAEYEPLGIPFDPPGVRVSRLEESLQILKMLFAGGPVSFHGAYYTIEEFEGFPLSVQRPHLPILVAGAGDRMLRIAAREADIVGIQTVNTTSGDVVMDPHNWFAATVERKVELIRGAAGLRFDGLELNTTISVDVTDDRECAARRIIDERGWQGVAVDDVLEMPALLIGTLDQIGRQICERRDQFGLSYLVVSEKNADLIAPLVGELSGT